jgi:hypothetical protein
MTVIIIPSEIVPRSIDAHTTYRYPKVCVVARTFRNANREMLLAFLHSVKAQAYREFELWLIDTDNPLEGSFHNEVAAMDDGRFKVKTFNASAGSYGYYATEYAVRELITTSSSFMYLLVTNGDNLYSFRFLQSLIKVLSDENNSPCIAASHFISRYNDSELGPNHLKKTMFVMNHVDLGAAVTRLDAVQRAYSRETEIFRKNSITADYSFFETVIRAAPNPNCAKVTREVLFTHQ